MSKAVNTYVLSPLMGLLEEEIKCLKRARSTPNTLSKTEEIRRVHLRLNMISKVQGRILDAEDEKFIDRELKKGKSHIDIINEKYRHDINLITSGRHLPTRGTSHD